MDKFDPKASDTENICRAIYALARAVDSLGFGEQQERREGPGAFEGHTMIMRDKVGPDIAGAIHSGLNEIAEAIRETI